MKINPLNNPFNIYGGNANKERGSVQSDAKVNQQTGQDKIEFSRQGIRYNNASQLKGRAVEEIAQGTDIQKIERIKAELENGTYHVSSEQIANAMLFMNHG